MSEHETPLGVVIKGAVAGLAGTGVLTVAMEQVPKLLEQVGLGPSKRGEGTGAGGGRNPEQPVEKLAKKVAEGVFDKRLDRKERKVAGQAIHWAYGASWGVMYGIMQSTFRLPHLLHGTLLAGLMSLAAATIVPATKVVPPMSKLPLERSVLQFAYIVLSAWTTALVYGLLSRKK
jgi:hypothetical protein